MLAVASACAPTDAWVVRLTSLTMKLGVPPERMVSCRLTPGRLPRSAGSPRELTAVDNRSPRKTQEYLPAYSGKCRLCAGPTSWTTPLPRPWGAKKFEST